MSEFTITVNDAGFAGFISHFGAQEGKARFSHAHGQSWVFNSHEPENYWAGRYYGSDYAPVNDATVRMLKMRRC